MDGSDDALICGSDLLHRGAGMQPEDVEAFGGAHFVGDAITRMIARLPPGPTPSSVSPCLLLVFLFDEPGRRIWNSTRRRSARRAALSIGDRLPFDGVSGASVLRAASLRPREYSSGAGMAAMINRVSSR